LGAEAPGSASAPEIVLERNGSVGTITINRPPLNILTTSAFESLARAVSGLTGRDPVDILVIRAAGDRAFSAGADVADHTPERAPGMLAAFHSVARALWSVDAVSVAVVQGLALGAGMELALCCDIVVAAEEASFGQPEIHVGSFPPIAAAVLPAMLGRQRAADIILTGRRFSAFEGLALGVVTRLAPAGELDDEVARLVGELAGNSAPVMRQAVRALRRADSKALSEALGATERIYLDDLLPLEDAREGVRAFLEKREPRWKNRPKETPDK